MSQSSSGDPRRAIYVVIVIAALIFGLALVLVLRDQTGSTTSAMATSTPTPQLSPSPPTPQPSPISANQYSTISRWTDLSTWLASNLTIEADSSPAPSQDAKVERLVEDSQNIWRNAQTLIPLTQGQPVRATAEIKGEPMARHGVMFIFSGRTRISCDLDPLTGKTAPLQSSDAKVVSCTATALGNGWWRLQLAGTLNSVTEQGFLTIAITRDGFHEDYQGDGKSGILVGQVTLEGTGS